MIHESHVWRWRQHRFRTDWRCRLPFYCKVAAFFLPAVYALACLLGFA